LLASVVLEEWWGPKMIGLGLGEKEKKLETETIAPKGSKKLDGDWQDR
jgi:hypothetical protein